MCAASPHGTSTAAANGKVLAIGDLTWQDIGTLDREKTLFLLAVGMLEEHGPHLPIAADSIGVEYEAGEVAARLTQALPEWNIALMPAVNYGSSGVNHAGVGETSGLLAIRPDLVRSDYRNLPPYHVENRTEMRDTASKPGWLGYFSSPAKANAAYGRDVEAWWVDGMTDLILQALRGENLHSRPRWPGLLQDDPEYGHFVEHALQPEREFALKFEHWLDRQNNK